MAIKAGALPTLIFTDIFGYIPLNASSSMDDQPSPTSESNIPANYIQYKMGYKRNIPKIIYKYKPVLVVIILN